MWIYIISEDITQLHITLQTAHRFKHSVKCVSPIIISFIAQNNTCKLINSQRKGHDFSDQCNNLKKPIIYIYFYSKQLQLHVKRGVAEILCHLSARGSSRSNNNSFVALSQILAAMSLGPVTSGPGCLSVRSSNTIRGLFCSYWCRQIRKPSDL